jgi:hypothetical protein
MERASHYNVVFTLARHDPGAENKWYVHEEAKAVGLDEPLPPEPMLATGQDEFKRRIIGALGIPAARVEDVLAVTEDLGGFLDMTLKELHHELLRRLTEVLSAEETADTAD